MKNNQPETSVKQNQNTSFYPTFKRSIRLHVIMGIIFVLSTVACTEDSELGPNGEIKGQSGYLVGRVTNQNGEGIQEATVYIEHPIFKDRGAQVASSAKGDYKLAVVAGLGQWIAKGYVLKEFNGRVYKTLLHPDNANSFSVEEKPVRNFQWKIQGHIPDLSLNMYYGGSAELYRDPNSHISDSENVEFIFTPEGVLIDGSAGKTLKLSCGKNGSNNYNIIHDIPIGRYKVSAIYKSTGAELLVSDAWGDGEYRPTVTMDFFGTEASYRANQMGIGYREK